MAILLSHTGEAPSVRLQISDPVIALDFDLAVSYRLLEWQSRRERDTLKTLYQAIYMAAGNAFGGGELPELFEEDSDSF